MKLQEYFAKYGMMKMFLAKKANLPIQTILKAYKNNGTNILHVAIQISDATDGRVGIRELVMPKDKRYGYQHEKKRKTKAAPPDETAVPKLV